MKNIRNIVCLIICFNFLIVLMQLSAQSPYAFNYQALARDQDGLALADQEIMIRISLVEGFEEGSVVFSEEHLILTDSYGIFSLRIGDGATILGNLRNIEWGEDIYFIRTELDPTGSRDYIDMGVSQLYSVPYALYANTSGSTSSSSGSESDDQQLSFSGTALSIENGNSVDLASLKRDMQEISFSGTILSIENGNSVDLGSLKSDENDADSDPMNELQTLSLVGNQLSISQGNSITLPSSTGGNSPWTVVSQDQINYDGLDITVGSDPTNAPILIGLNSNNSGIIGLDDNRETGGGSAWVDGEFGHYSFNKNDQLNYYAGNYDSGIAGFFSTYQNGQKTIGLNTSIEGAGFIDVKGMNGSDNVLLTFLNNNPNNGFLSLKDKDQNTKAAMYVAENEYGSAYTRGANGNLNVSLTSLLGRVNNGYISVNDSNGDEAAGIYVNSNGQGVVFGDIKNFRTPHPKKADCDIVYASLEGPEAAAYMRGTTILKNGQGIIDFPDHFTHIISDENITILLTPLSAESKGIAVIKKGRSGFRVQELFGGQGNYEFDWEVKAVRAGYEDYQVVRKRAEIQPSLPGIEGKIKERSDYRIPKRN